MGRGKIVTQEKTKKLQGLVLFTLCILLTGCGHEHTWIEATCTEPKKCSKCEATEGEPLGHTWVDATCSEAKHCSVCGETEGEPLEHTLTEANYQQPATCEVCGATVGEPLQADFDKYGIDCNAEVGVEYPYTTLCYDDNNYSTTGRVIFTEYEIFTSDDTHEALEGYEWRTVTTTAMFDDDNAHKYGALACVCDGNYYDIAGYVDYEDPNGNDEFVVEYNGIEYTHAYCEYELLTNGWVNDALTFTYRLYYRVPIGYDGMVFSWLNKANDKEESYINELVDDTSVIFRFD